MQVLWAGLMTSTFKGVSVVCRLSFAVGVSGRVPTRLAALSGGRIEGRKLGGGKVDGKRA